MTLKVKYSIIKTVKRDKKLLTVTKKSNRPKYAKSKRLPFTTRYAKTEIPPFLRSWAYCKAGNANSQAFLRKKVKKMKASDLKEILRICHRIGIEFVSELQDFARREQRQGESLIDALRRYELEVFYE